MGLHLLIVLVCLRVTLIYPYPYIPKTFLIIHVFIHGNHHIWSMNQPMSKECQHISAHISGFFQNADRVPISPIAPKGEVPKPWEGPYFHYFHGQCLGIWRDMDHQNRGSHGFGTSPRENAERVPISPIAPKGEVPKPWEGPYFPYFPYFHGQCLDIWRDMDHQNRGNRGPLMVLALHPGKTLRGSIAPKGEVPKPWEGPYFPYFPYFHGQCLDIWRGMDHQNRGNRGNRDPLMVLALHP